MRDRNAGEETTVLAIRMHSTPRHYPLCAIWESDDRGRGMVRQCASWVKVRTVPEWHLRSDGCLPPGECVASPMKIVQAWTDW